MNARMILDRAEAIGMNPLEKLKLVRELKMIRTDIAGAGAGALAALKKMKLAVRLKEIRARLGVGNPVAQAPEELETIYPAAPVPEHEAPAISTLNKAHTIKKANALTPAGALRADAINSKAPSSVWYYQGDMGQLQFTANVTMNGEPEKGADAAKAMLAQIKAVQTAGWSRRSMRAGSLGTVWVYEKDSQFLTRAGMENAGADVLQRPDMPKNESGYENMVQRQAALAKAFTAWLDTLTAPQQANRALVTRKMNETPVSEWARINDDKGGVSLQYLEPTGQWSIQISAPSFEALMAKIRSAG